MEKYLTIKELQYELGRLGLPCSRSYIRKLKLQGAPFVANRARLSELIEWLKSLDLKTQTSAFVCK